MKLIKLMCFFLIAGWVTSCSKDEALENVDNIPGLGGDTWVKGPLDNWIYDTLTVPFNIAVKYKWDQFELQVNRTIVPPKEDKVIPVLQAVKKVWIDTYIAEAGLAFFKTYAPKYFVLAGSASWNTDGTITLGTAEGGRKVVLYVVNEFRTKNLAGYKLSDSVTVKQQFHTIEHEFGHILNQTIQYPLDYKRVNVGLYTTNWNNVSELEALQDGFITPYSMSNPDEDFVEMVAVMLIEGRARYNQIVNGITGTGPNGTTAAIAKSRIRQKEAFVVDYFKTVWNIDFYSLQTRTRQAVEALLY